MELWTERRRRFHLGCMGWLSEGPPATPTHSVTVRNPQAAGESAKGDGESTGERAKMVPRKHARGRFPHKECEPVPLEPNLTI